MTGRSTMAGIERVGRFLEWLICVSRHPGIGLVIISLMLAHGSAAATGSIDISGVSDGDAPGEIPGHWQQITFRTIPNRTHYRVEIDPRFGPVIRAEASSSASLLSRELDLDPSRYPELSWHWKVSDPPANSSLSDPDGDDFPARLLVSFGSSPPGNTVPEATLCYVWADTEEIGTMVKSPALGGITTIVASNNPGDTGEWHTVRRNIVQDYRTAYGVEPPRIRAISLMTDSDDTKSHISAWYGPILLSPHPLARP